mmetsp:Transcript_23158/g.57360  ORF Transcript_23158/g.57360 Transcript_23158/m.57360 type:complete len:209 (-) Transcript_23158:858-1484(-)
MFPTHSPRESVASGRYPGPTQYTDKNTAGVTRIRMRPKMHVTRCDSHRSGTYTPANCTAETSSSACTVAAPLRLARPARADGSACAAADVRTPTVMNTAHVGTHTAGGSEAARLAPTVRMRKGRRTSMLGPYAWKYSTARLVSAASEAICDVMKDSDSKWVGSAGSGESPGCQDGPSLNRSSSSRTCATASSSSLRCLSLPALSTMSR